MHVSAIRLSLLMSVFALVPSAAKATIPASEHRAHKPIDRGFLTQDDVALFRALMQALEVVKIVHADEDTLAYLHSSVRADTFRFTIGGKPWFVKVAKVAYEPQMVQEIESAKYAGDRGWGPAVMPVPQKPYVLLTRFIEGASLRPEQLDDSHLRGQLLSKLAAVHSAPCTGEPLPRHEMIHKARRMRQEFIDSGRRGPVDDGAIEARLDVLEGQLQQARALFRMTHQDLWHGNVLVTPAQEIVLVDWDSLSCGEPFMDIAKLALLANMDAADGQMLLQDYLQRLPTEAETYRFAAVMGILEIDYLSLIHI